MASHQPMGESPTHGAVRSAASWQRAPLAGGSQLAIRLALLLLVAAAVALAARWVVRVPIFAAPDEDVHFDYVASLHTSGRILLARERPLAEIAGTNPYVPYTHPFTWELALAGDTKRMRDSVEVKVPMGYGTGPFYRALDERAAEAALPPLRNPALLREYPVGYYALTALWSAAWAKLFPGLVGFFFAARSLSVALLAAGLLAWWQVLRHQGCPPWRAVGILAVVALLPLTSFVCSYVQPDNLGFVAVPLCLWMALRAARSPPSVSRLAAVGLALALLSFTKHHLFLVVGLGVIPLLALAHWRSRRGHWLQWVMILFAPGVLAAQVQLWILDSPRGASLLRNLTSSSRRTELLQKAGSIPAYLVRVVRNAGENFFGQEGDTFATFWYRFGWPSAPVVVIPLPLRGVLLVVLQVATIALVCLVLLRWLQVGAALGRLWRCGKRESASRVLLGKPMLTALLAFAALIGGLFVYTANGFYAQGRNWYALLPVLVWCAVEYAPRALAPRRLARACGWLVLAGLLAYGLGSSYVGLRSLESRYYHPPSSPLAVRR